MAAPKTVNVLIVDDDRATQRMLADALTKQGFTVTVERDGEWAIKTFEKKGFDAVLLDLLLPALNGYEVARQMRALPKGKRTPIVMISGVYKNALHQREAVQKHGAFAAFLEKPMRLQALYDTLKQALGAKYPKLREPEPPPPPVEDDEVTGEHLADLSAREEQSEVEQVAKKVETSAAAYQVIRGDFAQKPFAEVLAEIYRWRGTGALLLRREKAKKIVYFRDGTPTSVKSNLLAECLGRVMVREKMISEHECEQSLTRMKTSKRQQGTVLIEMGCISPHNLQHGLVLQLQTKLFDVFSWDAGEYQFNPKAEPPSETVDLGLTTAQMIHEGIKRCFDGPRLVKWFSDVENLYVHPSMHPLYALQDARLGDDEQRLLEAADGHQTVTTLRALDLLPALETDRLLFAMKCAQMIELKATPAEGKKTSIAELAKAAASVSKPPPLPAHGVPPPLPPKLPVPSPSAAAGGRSCLAPVGGRAARAARAGPAPPPAASATRRAPPRSSPSMGKSGKGKDRRDGPVLARASSSLLPELSAVVSTSRLSGEESVIRERLAAKVAAMRKLDYFEILGLPTTANREDVKRAYFALAKEYHPDKHFGSSSAEVRQLAQQIYDLISTAHDTLADPIERGERSVTELARGVKRDIGDEVGKILAAEGKFQRGEELMRQREYVGAHRHFQDAIALYGDKKASSTPGSAGASSRWTRRIRPASTRASRTSRRRSR